MKKHGQLKISRATISPFHQSQPKQHSQVIVANTFRLSVNTVLGANNRATSRDLLAYCYPVIRRRTVHLVSLLYPFLPRTHNHPLSCPPASLFVVRPGDLADPPILRSCIPGDIVWAHDEVKQLFNSIAEVVVSFVLPLTSPIQTENLGF